MRTAASSDALRGAIGRARRTDPPSGGLFHVWARILAGLNAAPYNLHGPVRIPDEFPTVRALGRAAAAALLLPAVLRRGPRPGPASRHDEGVRERQPRRRRAGTDRRRRGRRARAARRARGALRPRLRGFDLRLRRCAPRVRLSRARRRRGRRLVAGHASRPRARAVGDRERGLRGDGNDGLRHGELRRRQPPARRCRRSEERRVRPTSRRGAGDRGDLGRDARRASGLLERGTRGDADARRRGGRRARASARRCRARGGPEAERGAARTADRPASGRARAQQRARPAGRPPAAGRPARAAPRRRCCRLLPPRQRARPLPLRRGARLRQRRCSPSSSRWGRAWPARPSARGGR